MSAMPCSFCFRRLLPIGVLVGATLGVASPGFGALLRGGGNARTDCYAVLDVDGVAAATSTRVAECTDGDPACDKDGAADDRCRFQVALCLNQGDARPTCVPPAPPSALRRVQPRGRLAGIQVPPLDGSACGAFLDVDVPVRSRRQGRVKRPGRVKGRLVAVSPERPRRDADRFTLVCNPSTGQPGPTPQGVRCPANPTGADAPNEIILRVKETGTDLDNGWKGPSMNFPTPAGTTLQVCLANCDGTSDTECDATIRTGPTTFNRETFGPPLPLFTAGVPVCVINEYAAAEFPGGSADLATGRITGPLSLNSHVFLTSSDRVCPKCENGRCDSGPRQGQTCQVDGTVTVVESTAANKTFNLSKDCPPPDNAPAGTLRINLPLTTEVSTLAPLPGGSAQTPCVQQPGEARGVTPAPDQCSGATCSPGCTGTACVRMEPHPVTGEMVCIDAKGGISQFCCSNDTARPCQPTRDGTPIVRTGRATPPQPPVPDTTYPKTSDAVSVATFCEAATGTGSVDGLTGLPGPGALILNSSACWTTPNASCP